MRATSGALLATLLSSGCINWSSLYRGVCGNGRTESDEECDDGNQDDADACLSTCRFARCGDGFVRKSVEQCDPAETDGSAEAGSCSPNCLSCDASNEFLWALNASDDAAANNGNGHFYSFREPAAAFAEASASCSAAGASLLTYPGYFDAGHIYRGLLKDHVATTFIGLYRHRGNFLWMSGEGPPTRPYWAQGEPAPSPSDCVVQGPPPRTSSEYPLSWTSVVCTEAHEFVCESRAPLVRPENNHAYRVLYERTTWDHAKTTCERLGGHLVTINDQDEQTFVTSQGIRADVWIGANDVDVQFSYVWVTKEPFGYSKLAPWDGPDATNRCLLLNADSYWYTRRCSDDNAFIVEIE